MNKIEILKGENGYYVDYPDGREKIYLAVDTTSVDCRELCQEILNLRNALEMMDVVSETFKPD